MNLDYAQLAALASVVSEGSFEAAARALHITPSALSQRIRQLEQRLGGVLVLRGKPCSITPLGEPLLRHAQQVALLEQGITQAALKHFGVEEG
ncbi:MAG: LysR family transcriptional regulator, partial [Inhella sp.]